MTDKKVDKAKEIFSDLRAAILKGKLKQGDHLVETKIASEYATSRLHVKSAFRLLEAEQLVEYIKMRGFIVLGVSASSLEEITEMRQALEGVIIKKVINTASAENIEELRRIANRVSVFIKNNMVDDGLQEVDIFYQTLYDICNYRRITNILNTYSDYISSIRNLSASNIGQHEDSLQNLCNLVTAIEERNIIKALQLLEDRHKYLSYK